MNPINQTLGRAVVSRLALRRLSLFLNDTVTEPHPRLSPSCSIHGAADEGQRLGGR